jgi:hypothetical protein
VMAINQLGVLFLISISCLASFGSCGAEEKHTVSEAVRIRPRHIYRT